MPSPEHGPRIVPVIWMVLLGCTGGAPAASPFAFTEATRFAKDADPPVCQDEEITAVIDVHEHAVGQAGLDALLAAIEAAGVDRTVAFSMLDGRYEDSLLLIKEAANLDGVLIPFTTVDVRDPVALGFLKSSVAAGAAGLKLFSGHGDIHGDLPLDSPLAKPIYDFLESTGTPLLMHVNAQLYVDELERVLDAHPDLVMICPHLCLLARYPGHLARLLDRYPNLSVDLSFGNQMAARTAFGAISRNIEVWKRFVRVHVDRITFGSDTVFTSAGTALVGSMNLESYLGLVQDDSFVYLGTEYNGLAADACTQKHILQHNAERFVAGLPPERAP